MTDVLTARAVRRRYLTLVAMRWFPTGLLIPVFVLLPLERGLSLSEIGLAAAGQGLIVLFLELPTGGLADSLGRKQVLMASTLVGVTSVGIYLFADILRGVLCRLRPPGCVPGPRQRAAGSLVRRCDPRRRSRGADPARAQRRRDRPRGGHRRRRPAQRASRHTRSDQRSRGVSLPRWSCLWRCSSSAFSASSS